MFNRNAAFGRTAFNREFSVDVFASAIFHGVATFITEPVIDGLFSARFDGEGTFDAPLVREIYFTASIDGIGEMSGSYVRERFGNATFNGVATFTADGGRYRVEYIEITGGFAPGDKIVIDTKKLKVTKNGVIAPYNGDFFEINPGTNTIIYTDPATSRNVKLRLTHRDRFM
ncbi:hypothetical protein PACILC2_22940 [Paenibacillus cisolokensis]|uniref:Siphovirus-type tail component C-terminal domain-containing protein n=1 Tax=Paenibacillus cisolokensis TaxID=1658519 RepID=A0ABQ4N6D9_9BACL|nr:phage tail domain-containing protein [Paenibacillus cisolokensis]GIQ63726.1 hypothetical protein PACILC2_22940 [Paenibacillus cisolokensis]